MLLTLQVSLLNCICQIEMQKARRSLRNSFLFLPRYEDHSSLEKTLIKQDILNNMLFNRYKKINAQSLANKVLLTPKRTV